MLVGFEIVKTAAVATATYFGMRGLGALVSKIKGSVKARSTKKNEKPAA